MKVAVTSCLLYLAGWLLAAFPAAAQIKITYPATRAVFQRDQSNNSTIYVAGTYAQPVNKVEARLVKMADGQGNDTDWQPLQTPQGGVFQGAVKGTGGWYQLEIRAWQNSTLVGQDKVQRIGIGEVFIITGQSNAQGFQQQGAAGATDDRVNCVTYDNSVAQSLNNPPSPTFRQLGADALVGPRGQSAWCWGILGDLITKKYNVPVLFINTAWAGTSIKNWTESARGQITKNIFLIGTPNENFPVGMPYGNLLVALRYYSSLQGVKAILWQQGETDNVPLNLQQEEYRLAMQLLINITRADTKRYPAWMLARSSYNLGKVNQGIINAQNQVINTFNNNVFAGPETDKVQIPRYDATNGDGGVHFGGDGLRQYAEAWFASMNERFFSGAIPLLPLPAPVLTATCATTTQSITLNLPAEVKDQNGDTYQFSDITWSNGAKGRNLTVTTAGTYYAIAKDEKGTTFLSPSITVATPIVPATPVISPSGQLQACADSAVVLSTNAPTSSAILWSNNSTDFRLTARTTGSYTARATNIYGCTSGTSAPVSLQIQPRLAAPTIAQIGPYSLQASLQADTTGQAISFDWKRGTELLAARTSAIKATQGGSYAARTRKIYQLGSSSLTCYSVYSNAIEFAGNDGDENDMVAFPNPSVNGVVQIATRENVVNAEIQVLTLAGQVVYSKKTALLDNQIAINLSALSTGNYLVQIRGDGYRAVRRIWIK